MKANVDDNSVFLFVTNRGQSRFKVSKHLLLKGEVLEIVHNNDVFRPFRKVPEPFMER